VCVLLEPEWGPEGEGSGDGDGGSDGSGDGRGGLALPGGGGGLGAGGSWRKLLRSAGDACSDGRPLLFGMAWTRLKVSTFSLFARVELPGL
jgi:hypothetical protein